MLHQHNGLCFLFLASWKYESLIGIFTSRVELNVCMANMMILFTMAVVAC